MASAGTITVDFAAETAKFQAELKQVNSRLKGMESGFSSLASVAKLSLGFLSVSAVVGFGKAMFDAADAIGDASARMGVSAAELSKLKFVASQSDVEFQSLAIGIKTFQKNLVDTNPALKELGLSAQALKQLSLNQQFEAIAEAFRGVQNPADKTRLSMELFGKAGSDLIPLLDQGAAGMRSLGDEAERVGAVMSDETAKGISDADAALKKLSATMEGYATKVLGYVALGVFRVFNIDDGAKFRDQTEALNDALADRREILDQIAEIMANKIGRSRSVNAWGTAELIDAGRELAEIDARIQKINESGLKLDTPASAPAIQELAKLSQGVLSEVSLTSSARGGGIGLSGGAAEVARAQTEIEEIIRASHERQAEEENARLVFQDELLEKQVNSTLEAAERERQIRSDSARDIANSQIAEAERSAAARKAVEQSVVTAGISALNAFNSASTKKSKELVAINKAVSIAQAIQNTYVGATKAIAQGGVFGFVSAGAIIAFGLAQVAAIARTNYGSSGNSTTASGTSVNPVFTTSTSSDSDTQGASQQNVTQVIFNGPVSEKQWIIDAIQEAVNDNDVVIISANSRQAAELQAA